MNRINNNEKGFALISVMMIVAVLSVFVASAISISQICVKEVAVSNALNASIYETEAAANRVRWLLLEDRKKYPFRNLLIQKNKNLRDENQNSFIADNKARLIKINNLEVEYTIMDAAGGINLYNGVNMPNLSVLKQNFVDNENMQKKLQTFSALLNDYIDKDNLIRLNSMEQSDYESMNMNLPKNGPLRYREEILMLPEASLFFKPDSDGRLSSVNLITPFLMSQIPIRNNLFNANKSTLNLFSKLNDDNIADIISQLESYRKNNISREDMFSSEQKKSLRDFSVIESGFYTIKIKIKRNGLPSKTFFVTEQVNNLNSFSNKKRIIYEAVCY